MALFVIRYENFVAVCFKFIVVTWYRWWQFCEQNKRLVELRLFSHESKVRNLNYHLNCTFWMIIQKTVFWTVSTPNYIAMRHLKCAFQMTVRRCFPVMHIANHTAKSPYECLDLYIVIWGWPSNHFRLYTARCMYKSTGNASSVHVWLAG